MSIFALSPFWVENTVVFCALFVLGAVFGSMLNVCIYRLPRDESFWRAMRYMVYPPSHCPRCSAPILPRDNLPIFGWLILRGRCRNCRGAISPRYPLIELLTALLFVTVYWFEAPSLWWTDVAASSVYHPAGPAGLPVTSWMSPAIMLHGRYAVHMVLVLALIVATFIDIDLRIIPDTVTLPALAVGVLANAIAGQVYIVPLWYQTPAMWSAAGMYGLALEPFFATGNAPAWLVHAAPAVGVPGWIAAHPHLHGLCLSLAGIAVGGGIIWAVRLVGYWALKREAMGFGDVILMAMIGSFIGWQGTVIVFVLALLSAVVVAIPLWLIWRDHELPFGPYLALGTLLLLLAANRVWPWFDTRVFAMGFLLVPVGLVMAGALGTMLIVWRRIQKSAGLAAPEPQFEEAWQSGDQLAYLAGECRDDRQGQWPRHDWPGRLSGRGQSHEQAWRRRDGFQAASSWQRRAR